MNPSWVCLRVGPSVGRWVGRRDEVLTLQSEAKPGNTSVLTQLGRRRMLAGVDRPWAEIHTSERRSTKFGLGVANFDHRSTKFGPR